MRRPFLIVALLMGLFALPTTVAAAGSCGLSTALVLGHSITVIGSGFDPSTTVDVTQVWSGSNATAGGNTGPQTTASQVTSDASGGFTFAIDAGPGRGGTYDITATAGGCTATTQADALETAGGTNPGGGGVATPGGIVATGTSAPTLPPTDTDPLSTTTPSGTPLPLLPIGLGVALLAVAALLVSRRDRPGRRTDRRA